MRGDERAPSQGANKKARRGSNVKMFEIVTIVW
jgi:hypothetical protein